MFATLDWLERHLEGRRYLCGERLTEADVRLLPTLVRFDPAYYVAFRCDRRRIADYPNLSTYLARLLEVPGVAGTVMPAESYRRGYAPFPSPLAMRAADGRR